MVSLTDREKEIVELIAQGGTDKAIAEKLGISPGTVKNLANTASDKLGATNRPHLVTLALQQGILLLEPAPYREKRRAVLCQS